MWFLEHNYKTSNTMDTLFFIIYFTTAIGLSRNLSKLIQPFILEINLLRFNHFWWWQGFETHLLRVNCHWEFDSTLNLYDLITLTFFFLQHLCPKIVEFLRFWTLLVATNPKPWSALDLQLLSYLSSFDQIWLLL